MGLLRVISHHYSGVIGELNGRVVVRFNGISHRASEIGVMLVLFRPKQCLLRLLDKTKFHGDALHGVEAEAREEAREAAEKEGPAAVCACHAEALHRIFVVFRREIGLLAPLLLVRVFFLPKYQRTYLDRDIED